MNHNITDWCRLCHIVAGVTDYKVLLYYHFYSIDSQDPSLPRFTDTCRLAVSVSYCCFKKTNTLTLRGLKNNELLFFQFLRVGWASPLLVLPGLIHAVAFSWRGSGFKVQDGLTHKPGSWCWLWGVVLGFSSVVPLPRTEMLHMAISGEFSKKPNVKLQGVLHFRCWDFTRVAFSKFHWLKEVTRPAQVQEVGK